MKAYITYDYELCMGLETGTPLGCLIKPMDAVETMFDRYNIKCSVFVDAAYLLKMEELKDNNLQIEEDYNLVVNHIKRLASRGHSIQLHYHPQWLYAEYKDDKWVLDNNHYKLSDLPIEIQRTEIQKAINLLNSLTNKKICAFRAGGFSIENFEDVADIFEENGIQYDTSALRGGRVVSKYQTYDYRNIPSVTSYKFDKKVSSPDTNGRFVEYPISVKNMFGLWYSIKKTVIRKFQIQQVCQYSPKRWNDGVGIGHEGSGKSIIVEKIAKSFSQVPLYASADGSLVPFLPEVYEYSKRRYKGNEFVIIGHPKIASPQTIRLLEIFIEKYRDEIEFVTF